MTAVPEQLLLDSPAARPCTCPRAQHQHGTLAAYTRDECRCGPCVAAHRDYQRHRYLAMSHGQWAAWADAVPVRAHLDRLIRQGLSWRTIAARAGVGETTVRRILYGTPARSELPVNRIRARTATALLAVTSGRVRAAETPNLLTKET